MSQLLVGVLTKPDAKKREQINERKISQNKKMNKFQNFKISVYR
jgi:hypothetical protein